MSDNENLIYAEQQLLGFAHAKEGHSPVDLVESMALSRDEWEDLDGRGLTHLTGEDRREVIEYFERGEP